MPLMRTRPELQLPPDIPRPGRARRLGRGLSTAAAVIFLAALIASGLILWLVPAPDGPATPAPGRPVTSAPADPAAPSDSVCGLPAGDQAIPRTAPPVTTWEIVGTMAAPAHPELGPCAMGAGLRYGYAHSPTGALYAAAGYVAAQTNPELRLPSAQYLTAAGPGQEALLAQLTHQGEPSTADFQLRGSHLDYGGDTATVELAFTFSGQLAATSLPLRWEAGDWKVVAAEDGTVYRFGQITEDDLRRNFVPWRGR